MVEVTKLGKTDESIVVLSPNKVLHDIISHNVGEVGCSISKINQIAK